MTNLNALADRVEAGERYVGYLKDGKLKALHFVIADVLDLDASYRTVIRNALNGSLNAARTIHNAVLPKWIADIKVQPEESYAKVYYWPNRKFYSEAPTPSRAWVAAILRALAQENHITCPVCGSEDQTCAPDIPSLRHCPYAEENPDEVK